MARLEGYTDEDVAQALKKDANERSAKYSSLGLQAFLPNRQKGPTARPNTRFLQNVLRDTDNHNAALLAKEKREAREKQRRLLGQTGGASESSRTKGSRGEHRRTADKRRNRDRYDHQEKLQHGDHNYGRLSRSRSRSRSTSWSPSSRDRRKEVEEPCVKRKRNDSKHRDQDTQRRKRRTRDSRKPSPNPGPTTTRGAADRYYPRKRANEHRFDCRDNNVKRQTPQSSRSRSPPPKRYRSKFEGNSNGKPSKNSSLSEISPPRNNSVSLRSRQTTPDDAEDSDPLEDLIGPLPPPQGPRPRGRGVANAASNIDDHFAANYDPSADLSPESAGEGDDWDNAVEAFRDRQKWKQIGANRLREAGFGENEVKKWESGINDSTRTKDERDVKWAGKGEAREWDRGKVVDDDDDDGLVRLEANWSRLKGT